MRNWAGFGAALALLAAGLIWSEAAKPEAYAGAEPVINFIADSQRELTRLPATFARLPDDEEIAIGRRLETEYVPILVGRSGQDQFVEDYVQTVGARVASHAHRKLPYRFHYIPASNFVNAFALPGGVVFIGGGLMRLMNTEDELAAVLGHEIEHVDHYHCAERVQMEAALHNIPAGELIGIPVEVFAMGYSKAQELEADREGTKLASMAGYAPQGAIELFEVFQRFEPRRRARAKSPVAEVSGIASDALDGYFRSHPLNSERIEQIRKLMASGELPKGREQKPLEVSQVFTRS